VGFFAESEIETKKTVAGRRRCGSCGLLKSCKSPNLSLAGSGKKEILVVADVPGEEEDEWGRILKCNAGDVLRIEMRKHGVDLYNDCWLTASTTCYSKDDPTDVQLESCLPGLVKIIEEKKPKIILCLGRWGIVQTMRSLWSGKQKTALQWLGCRIPSIDWNAWVCATWHPAFVMTAIKENQVESVIWRRHIKNVLKLKKRPLEKANRFAFAC
jgi:uracil-DNA glycosylase family 4